MNIIAIMGPHGVFYKDEPGGTHEHHCHYGTAWRLL